jgi:hypothetical protein
LLTPAAAPELSTADRTLIQDLFFVGGYSFNSTKKSDDDSRRIELKLEFYALKEKQEASQRNMRALPAMAVRDEPNCPIDAR